MEPERYTKSYSEYKAELDAELSRTAEGFVRIGYLLKVARDTMILWESPYTSVVEFARAEYGIDKTQVSRFIRINDRFSEGGYSDRLEEHYRGFGYAKLAIMLQLPDAVNDIVSPSYSKEEILTLKEEIDAEKEVTDLELLLEAAAGTKADGAEESLLCRAVLRLGEDDRKLYCRLHEEAAAGWPPEALQDAMAPSGERTYSIRIAGVGRVLLSLKTAEQTATLVSVRSGEKETYSWEDVAAAWDAVLDTALEAEESWEKTYGRELETEEPEEEADRVSGPGTGGAWEGGNGARQKQAGKEAQQREEESGGTSKPQKKKESRVVRAVKREKKPAADKTETICAEDDVKVSESNEAETAGEIKTFENGENGAETLESGMNSTESASDALAPERVDDIAEIMPDEIPGQMEVADYPELLPEAERRPEQEEAPEPEKAAEGSAEEKVAPVQPVLSRWEARKRRMEWLGMLKESLDTLYRAAEKGIWEQVWQFQDEIGKELEEMRKLGQVLEEAEDV